MMASEQKIKQVAERFGVPAEAVNAYLAERRLAADIGKPFYRMRAAGRVYHEARHQISRFQPGDKRSQAVEQLALAMDALEASDVKVVRS